jgi:hypothetical protein
VPVAQVTDNPYAPSMHSPLPNGTLWSRTQRVLYFLFLVVGWTCVLLLVFTYAIPALFF